jgi:hypothetical protein
MQPSNGLPIAAAKTGRTLTAELADIISQRRAKVSELNSGD